MTARVDAEIVSQPDCWERAIESATKHADVLPAAGSRVAVMWRQARDSRFFVGLTPSSE